MYAYAETQSLYLFSHSSEKRTSGSCYPEDTNRLRMIVWVIAVAVFFACSSPAAVPGAGRAACRAPAPGLPTAAPMPRGPPPPAPAPSPGVGMLNGNRRCVDSFASVSPSAPPGPGFHVCWPPSDQRVSAGHSPSPPTGAAPRPPLGSRLSHFLEPVQFARAPCNFTRNANRDYSTSSEVQNSK